MVAGSKETTMAEDVVNEGACAPFDLLSEHECAEVVAEAKRVLPECHWKKSLHEKGERCRAIAADERITSIVKKALGTEDVIVWGTYLVEKAAGQNHRWHADCESQRWETINAWIPLTNVGKESYMSYIPRSHKYPMQCQDVVPRGLWECDDAGALAFAKENYDENATIERWKDMRVGQVAIKNANCWHATINATAQPREALLVQYCRYL
jgi:ectoine hydroxylase-related dioxygenase (phytanoyl-CoA dioxygenase family)